MVIAAVSLRRKLRHDAQRGTRWISAGPRHRLQRHRTSLDGAELPGARVIAGERHAVSVEHPDVHGDRVLPPQIVAGAAGRDRQVPGRSRRAVRRDSTSGAVGDHRLLGGALARRLDERAGTSDDPRQARAVHRSAEEHHRREQSARRRRHVRSLSAARSATPRRPSRWTLRPSGSAVPRHPRRAGRWGRRPDGDRDDAAVHDDVPQLHAHRAQLQNGHAVLHVRAAVGHVLMELFGIDAGSRRTAGLSGDDLAATRRHRRQSIPEDPRDGRLLRSRHAVLPGRVHDARAELARAIPEEHQLSPLLVGTHGVPRAEVAREVAEGLGQLRRRDAAVAVQSCASTNYGFPSGMKGECMKTFVTRTILSIAVLAFAVPALPLFAQQTADKPPEKKEEKKADEEKKPKVTEEMVVTARKREETVQEVPISVAAPTESELRDRGAQSIEDVAANVAGFTVQNLGPGQSQVAMRGVSAGQIVRDQPGVKEQVGVYLDESVISLSLFTPDIDLFDLNRVEVLRGPQGTLFGSGSLSGTVRYITKQPQLKVQDAIGEFGVDTIDNGSTGGSAKVAVNHPISDTAAMRFAGYYTKYGGFTDAIQPNLSIKRDVNDG